MSRWEWEGKVPAKWTALKAPDLRNEPKERQVPAGIKTETSTPTWNEADLEFRYFRKELQDFMTHNPIMRTLQPTQIGDQTGPVTTPATAGNKLEAIKILMNLLQEAGRWLERSTQKTCSAQIYGYSNCRRRNSSTS
ncbi:hypothetical protein PF008_g7353 [Phytophthora fragariae]|uniref:Uncharacterized protein n=1 Tax=Phytophthora fragariae TaxID=53985 RepID=A0A6G0S2X6_9STRA|nr:hypothetical protein PF008_g7353 [Phytophthora fragariae]